MRKLLITITVMVLVVGTLILCFAQGSGMRRGAMGEQGTIRRDLPNPGIQIGAVLPVWTCESPTPISWRSSHVQRGEY